MKIAMFPNLTRDRSLEVTLNAAKILCDLGVELLIPETVNGIDGSLFTVTPISHIFDDCDVALVVGGDGTMIHVAKQAAQNGIPTLGINAGRVGYLAGLEADELYNLKKLVTGDYTLSERMLLKASVDKKVFYCLNDAVIHRGELSRMVDITVDIDGSEVHIRADGIIVSTPTGSTAYSLSAGGPVVDPSVEAMVLTYICPQTPGTRPVVLNANSVLNVSALSDESSVYLTVDGEEAYKLSADSRVEISRDFGQTVKLINIKSEPFFNVLSRKIK